MLTSTRPLLITLREHPVQGISSLLDNPRSQYAHLITTRLLIGDLNNNNPQSRLTHVLHFVARTLNIPSSQKSIANPHPTTTQQHDRYTRAATIYPCPILKVSIPGYPHMCEYCALLRHVLTNSHTNDYPLCASPHPNERIPTTCTSCVVFALIRQKLFVERWNDIQHRLVPAHQSQLRPSLNSSQSGNSALPTRQHGTSPLSNQAPTPAPTSVVVRIYINFILSLQTYVKIQKVLTTNPSSPLCTMIHIAHPVLPLTMKKSTLAPKP